MPFPAHPAPAPAAAWLLPADVWAWLGFLGGAVLLLLVLYGRVGRVAPQTGEMAFVDHARELRDRLLRVVVVFAAWSSALIAFRFEPRTFAGFPYATPVLDVFDNTAARLYVALAEMAVPDGVRLLVSRPTEAVSAQLQVSFIVAFALTLPVLLYEAWAFFAPGLSDRERRLVARSLPVAGILFFAGAAFGLGFVAPLLLEIFYRFAAPLGAEPFLAAGALVGTVITFAFLFGVAFELPLVLVLLVRLRVTTPHTYLHYWRHVTVAIFAVAALATDPTLMSQLIVGSVLLALYWGGVLASWVWRPTRGEPRPGPRSKPS